MKRRSFCRAMLLVLLGACFAYLISCQDMQTATSDSTTQETIGVAHLDEDGLLEITLRATGQNGSTPVGDAFFVYKEGTADYESFMKLVEGLKRGETKSIPATKGKPQ